MQRDKMSALPSFPRPVFTPEIWDPIQELLESDWNIKDVDVYLRQEYSSSQSVSPRSGIFVINISYGVQGHSPMLTPPVLYLA